jgi:hypothetical protein
MRATIHLVSRRDYWPLAAAIRRARREWWLRVRRPRPTERELEEAAARIRTLLAGGPQRQDELTKVLGRDWQVAAPWLELVRVPPAGTWEQRRANLFAMAEGWVGPERIDGETALDHLVRRYLGGFGPASRTDIASWAGLNVRELAPALARLRLRRFRDERGGELFDVPGAPLPHAETPAPVRFLPTWDATLLAHARRAGVMPEQYRPIVFSTKVPPSFPTFLVDGRVAGSWKHERGRIVLEPFERLSRADQRALDEEGERLAAFHA